MAKNLLFSCVLRDLTPLQLNGALYSLQWLAPLPKDRTHYLGALVPCKYVAVGRVTRESDQRFRLDVSFFGQSCYCHRLDAYFIFI